MAYKGKKIHNPVTGQSIEFVQTSKDTNGELLEMISTYDAYTKEPASHYHPYQDEFFEVLEGKVSLRIDGRLLILQQGDTMHIEKNQVHAMWNPTDSRSMINWKVMPAMNTEHLLETVAGLAADGKINEKGMPGILQVALIFKKFSSVFRLARMPYLAQTLLFAVLAPFSSLKGLKPTYHEYID